MASVPVPAWRLMLERLLPHRRATAIAPPRGRTPAVQQRLEDDAW